MADTLIDASAVRDQQRFVWDGVCAGWERWRADFERGASVVTNRLLDLTAVASGLTVLDVGSGVGHPALEAAERVGPTGRVVGVDLSPAMVAAARRAATDHPNVEFVEGAAETVDFGDTTFDAAVSRWALSFAADPAELLRSISSASRPGAPIAAAVWAAPSEVPMISLAFRVIAADLALPPPPDGPGPFALADPDRLAAALSGAGFGDVGVEEVVVPFELADVDAFVRFSRDVLPPRMRSLVADRYGSLDGAALWDDVAEAALEFRRPDGSVALPSVCWCVCGTAGAA